MVKNVIIGLWPFDNKFTDLYAIHSLIFCSQFQTNSTGSSLQPEPVFRVYVVVGKSRISSFSIPSLSYTNSLLSSFVVVDWDPHFVTFTTLTRSVPFNPLLIAVWRMFSNLFWCWETWDWGTESFTSYSFPDLSVVCISRIVSCLFMSKGKWMGGINFYQTLNKECWILEYYKYLCKRLTKGIGWWNRMRKNWNHWGYEVSEVPNEVRNE